MPRARKAGIRWGSLYATIRFLSQLSKKPGYVMEQNPGFACHVMVVPMLVRRTAGRQADSADSWIAVALSLVGDTASGAAIWLKGRRGPTILSGTFPALPRHGWTIQPWHSQIKL